MNERRIRRLQEVIKARVAEVVAYELADPRRGMVTITRVELDREMAHCKVFWSVLGDDKDRRLNERMLDHAAKHVQREVAKVLTTRTVPRVRFVFDESIEGVQRVQRLLDELRTEREAREARGELADDNLADDNVADDASDPNALDDTEPPAPR